MARTFHSLYYHVFWTTKYRDKIIRGSIEKYLFEFLNGKIDELGGSLIEANGVDDHIHILVRLTPRIPLSEIMHQVKGVSSREIKRDLGSMDFAWQGGYGVKTVSPRHIHEVVRYIRNQKEHHRSN